MSAKDFYDKVFRLMMEHHDWFNKSIPLIASENIPSPAVREAVLSDFGNRYAEGWPGDRVYAGCTYIDQVEIICNDLAKKLFRAEFADCRATSGVVANLAIYAAFSSPGDYMMAASIPSGGHISHGKREHFGTAGLVHGLNIEHYPFSKEEMTIEVDATKRKIEEMIRDGKAPKIAMFGGSLFLFPHPVKELSDFMHDRNMYINYDGAHVAGMTIALAESLEFGKKYAKQVIKNAKILAESLVKYGFGVLGERRGYTASHQIAVDVSKFGDGGNIERNLEKANIILNRQLLPGDIKAGRHYMHPSGIRIGVSEITRLGMKESEMIEIASLIKRVVADMQDSHIVAKDVIDFRKQFQRVQYAFDNAVGAYEYINLVG